MKTLFTIVSLLFATVSLAQLTTEIDIKALSNKRIQYLLQGKVDSLATIYDEKSMTVHTNGMIKTATEHLEDVRNGRPKYKSIEVKNTTVNDFGTTAILVGQGIFNITMNGQDMSYTMVYTEVYQKKNNQWKLIARHASSAN